MKITCDVIRDLLPLYAEDIANDDTKALIEEHLEGCETCMEKLEQMQQTQTLSSSLDNEFIGKMKANFSRVVLNILLVIAIFLAGLNLVNTSLDADIGFMKFDELGLNFQEMYNYETDGGMYYNTVTMEELVEMLEDSGEVFNPDNVIDLKLSLSITEVENSQNRFSRSNLTKVQLDGSNKYVYYIEPYTRLSQHKSSVSWQFFYGDDVPYHLDNEEKTDYKDYIEAVYIATPTKDYLVYGDDVATQKFEVTTPFLGLHIFTLVLIILSIACLIIRIKNKNSSTQKTIDVVSSAMIVMLLNTIFLLNFIIGEWFISSVYNYYLMFNSICLALLIIGVVASLVAIFNNAKTNIANYTVCSTLMIIGVIFLLCLEKIRIFEWLPIAPDYAYIFYPILPIILGIIFVLGYFIYKNDTLKPKHILTKEYKITQGILIFNMLALQCFSLYVFSLKFSMANQPTYVDGRSIFLNHIFLADTINLTSVVIIIFAFYSLIKHKDYLMLGVILQAVAICMEKGSYFNFHLPSLMFTMENLSFQVFILSYLMLGLTMFVNNKLTKNNKEVS